jgi:hypothetical protein
MESSFRKTSNSVNKFKNFSDKLLPPIRTTRNTRLNMQRRDKLASTLTEKFILKYGSKNNNGNLISNEVRQFLQRERLNERDLKKFELSLKKKINLKEKEETLKQTLINNLKPKDNYNINNNVTEDEKNKFKNLTLEKNDIDDSRMSGGSDLEKFDEKFMNDKLKEEEENNFKKINDQNKSDYDLKKVDFDLSKYANEWDAINMFNKKKYEEQLRDERNKNWEMRMRTRTDLNNQIKQKIIRKREQELRNLEYDAMQDRHMQYLNSLDEKKKIEIKKREIKEKEDRDKQLHDKYVSKRIAFLKNKLYEKELVKHNNEEIKLEKENLLAIKKKNNEELAKTLKDNALHKKKLEDEKKKEKENDIQMMEDSLANQLRRDNERKAYFEKIKKAGNNFSEQAVLNVYRLRDEQIKDEEEKMRQYNQMKEQLATEEDNRIKQRIKLNKKMMKEFYDNQVKAKKAKDDFEKQIDLAQGKIWKQDYLNYIQNEKEISKKQKEFEKKNLKILDAQIKMGKYDVDKGMSETEKLINFNILKGASEM